jgi:hypothetical protein
MSVKSEEAHILPNSVNASGDTPFRECQYVLGTSALGRVTVNGRIPLRNYSQCGPIQDLLAIEERTKRWLTALKSRTVDPLELANIQEAIDAANRVIDGLLAALAAAGCRDVPANYTGEWIYVAGPLTGPISVFSLGSNGDVPPSRIVNVSGSSWLSGLAVDSLSNLFVSDPEFEDSILVYGPGASGSVLPVRVIAGSLTGLSRPASLAVDQLDNLYVLNVWSPAEVTVYAPGTHGNAPPSRRGQGVPTYSGISIGSEGIPDIAVDGGGNLYLPHQGGYDAVTVYAPDGTQTRALTGLAAGAGLPGSGTPFSVAADSDGTLYVLEQCYPELPGPYVPYYVLVYPPYADGDAPAPSAVLDVGSGPDWPRLIRLDTYANIYVAVSPAEPHGSGAIKKWLKGSSGNAAPIATITGPLTGLSQPNVMAIYSADVNVPSISPGRIGDG